MFAVLIVGINEKASADAIAVRNERIENPAEGRLVLSPALPLMLNQLGKYGDLSLKSLLDSGPVLLDD